MMHKTENSTVLVDPPANKRVSFSKKEAIQTAKALEYMTESNLSKQFSYILHSIQEISFQPTISASLLSSVHIFLRILSQKIQQESRDHGAWRYYLYGKFDSHQEKLFDELIQKRETFHRKEILSKKHVASILKYLYDNGVSRQSSLAKNLEIDRSNLSRIMDQLISEELVEKGYGSSTSIAMYELTQKGYDLCTNSVQAAALFNVSSQHTLASPMKAKLYQCPPIHTMSRKQTGKLVLEDPDYLQNKYPRDLTDLCKEDLKGRDSSYLYTHNSLAYERSDLLRNGGMFISICTER